MTRNNLFLLFPLLCSVLLFSSCQSKGLKGDAAQTGFGDVIQLEYTYKNLKVFELDQMTDILNKKLNDYKNNNRLDALREGTLIVFSRPNEDDIVEKVISQVRYPLEDVNEWEATINQIVTQSIEILNDENNSQFTPTQQVTASVVLENIMAEFKPAFMQQSEGSGFETTVIQRIAANQLTFTSKALQDKKLNQMSVGLTPSQLAKKLIDLRDKKVKAEAEKADKKK